MPTARPKPQFTPRQVDQLAQLLAAGALSHEDAKHQFDAGMSGCSPLVLGKLRDMDLADSRVMRPRGGSQVTAYWLTPAGARTARRLAGSPPPPRRAVR